MSRVQSLYKVLLHVKETVIWAAFHLPGEETVRIVCCVSGAVANCGGECLREEAGMGTHVLSRADNLIMSSLLALSTVGLLDLVGGQKGFLQR